MDDEVTAEVLIARAIHKIKTYPSTRQAALVVTKLEEAEMWLTRHRAELKGLAARHGMPEPSPQI